MRKSVEATQRTFNTNPTGRANPSLLDKLSVEYYGAENTFCVPWLHFRQIISPRSIVVRWP